jgi:hypothetical protein
VALWPQINYPKRSEPQPDNCSPIMDRRYKMYKSEMA